METVYAMAIGDWSGLEQIDVGEVTEAEPRPTLRRRAVILLGAIARAVIPLVLAVAATQIDFGATNKPLVTGEIANYLLGGTAIYTAIVLVMAIDPELAARVSTAREIFGMIPTGDGRRDEQRTQDFSSNDSLVVSTM